LRKEQASRCFEKPARGDRQQRDENRTQYRTQHRAEPADDDHREVVDRDVDLELLVIGDAEVVALERSGNSGEERRDGKGVELVLEDVDADDLSGDVLVADGDKGAADT